MHDIAQVYTVEGLHALVLLRAPELYGPIRTAAQKGLSIKRRAGDAVDGTSVAGISEQSKG